jgi:hypothetical protein
MTPAEKAKLLVQKFYFSLPNNGGQTGLCNVHQRWDEGKICARIAADEIMNALEENGSWNYDYWNEVKQEVEKI